MVFSSLNFMFLFLPAVLTAYFCVPKKYIMARNMVLLAFSLFFYFYGEPMGIFIMLLSIASNYIFARLIDKKGATDKARRLSLIFSVIFNLGALCFYKYSGFLLQNLNEVFSLSMAIPKIIMPIGISFFTFQGMSYVFDVYLRRVPAQKNPLYVATYISLFPQLVAGPIVRYETVAEEMVKRTESAQGVADGLRRFVIGFSKKMLIANTMGAVAVKIFAMSPQTMGTAVAWLGAIAYTFQIYYDFSGYSDMAIGLGKVFGFNFMENFNYPYISKSITEFWRRWHISLSSWFRDYVYIPLGGNRKGGARQLFNIFVVWMLTGLWHGAAWNFILWGLYFAVILVLEKLFLKKILDKLWAPIAHIYSLILIIVGWVIFNSSSLYGALQYMGAMFTLSWGQASYGAVTLGQYKVEFLIAALLSFPVARYLNTRFENNQGYVFFRNACTILLFILSLLSMVNTTFNPFIYFRF